jgi:pyridoxine 4-dehydrogenase
LFRIRSNSKECSRQDTSCRKKPRTLLEKYQGTKRSDEVTAVNIPGRRMASAVLLIGTLGGGGTDRIFRIAPSGKLAMTPLILEDSTMSKKGVSALQAGTVSLGNEISVHRLGYGAMRLTGPGIWGPPKDRKAALAVLRRAVELGINFIDTADSYGPHVSEELIAEALHPYPSDLVIATKGGWERPGPNQWTHNATPDHLRKTIEGSLKRLRLERIDVYQLHAPDNVVSFDVSVETLAELKREGKIRMVGLSNVTQEHIERARRIVPVVSVQNRYSFADREWDYVVDYCERNGIVFIPWFPLGAGRIAGEVLDQVAQAHHSGPTQVALAWLLERSSVMLPIPGTSSIEHLGQNVAAACLRLNDEEYEKLAGVPALVATR